MHRILAALAHSIAGELGPSEPRGVGRRLEVAARDDQSFGLPFGPDLAFRRQRLLQDGLSEKSCPASALPSPVVDCPPRRILPCPGRSPPCRPWCHRGRPWPRCSALDAPGGELPLRGALIPSPVSGRPCGCIAYDAEQATLVAVPVTNCRPGNRGGLQGGLIAVDQTLKSEGGRAGQCVNEEEGGRLNEPRRRSPDGQGRQSYGLLNSLCSARSVASTSSRLPTTTNR
jgi:hypothetical protein